MSLPDLARLSLSPRAVADVGAVGDQCDPRDQEGGVCVVLVPMPYMYLEARNAFPDSVLNDDELSLAFRIDPNSSKWSEESPYDTLKASEQYKKFCSILGFVPPLHLTYMRDDGVWLILNREDGSWEELVRKKIIKTHPLEGRPQQFWTRFRYQMPSLEMKALPVQVLGAMHAYNERHPPVWKKVDEERRGLAAALAAAKADRAKEAQQLADERLMATLLKDEPAPAAPSPATTAPSPAPSLTADEPPLPADEPTPELPTMEEVLEDEFVKSLLDGAQDVPEFNL